MLASVPPHVQQLLRAVRVRRAQTDGDRLLAERLCALFEAEAAPPGTQRAQGLQLYVFEGAVTVYGRVASLDVRDAVVTALGGVPGVRSITDCLQLAG